MKAKKMKWKVYRSRDIKGIKKEHYEQLTHRSDNLQEID